MSNNKSLTPVGPVEINVIFKQLSLIYSDFLRAKSDDDIKFMKRIWLQQLESCRADCVDQTLARVPDQFPSFAPKVGEFKAMMPKVERQKLQSVGRIDYEPKPTEQSEKFRAELRTLVNAKKLNPDEAS